MVDYENLTQEELATLCKWIGEKAFKNVFEKNQRTLVRIYRDCRVKKLEMAQICDIVYRNRADKFIVNLLDDFSRQLLSISKKLTEEKIASGSNTETALIEVLAESPFHENIPLYFKLRDEEYSEDFIRMTTAAVAIMIRQAESTAEQGAEPDSEPTVNNDLRSEYEEQNRRIAELEQQLDTSRSETEQAKTAYFVVEWVTMSAPHSIGRQLTGVANVLSMISGTPWACAALAKRSMSKTISAGLASVSPKTHFVFGRKAASSSSSLHSGSTNVKSMPMRRIVTLNRL